jgi:hypothetical protein
LIQAAVVVLRRAVAASLGSAWCERRDPDAPGGYRERMFIHVM